jgi:RNA polymerase sigma factor (sigma-70 family)
VPLHCAYLVMTQDTDTELIDRALTHGDPLALQRLIERHRRSVTLIAYQALGNSDDAQDVAQEALAYALQRLGELRDRSRFAGWLRHITLSLCVDYRRRRGTRRLGEPITVLNKASEEANFADRLSIRQAVAHLSEAHRTVLLLHYVGGWSQAEVARLLAIPLNTVRSRLMAAKRLLRTDLQSLYPQPHRAQRKSMSTDTLTLSTAHTTLLEAAFSGARILSVQTDPEAWMPFSPRVRIALPNGEAKTVDFRTLSPRKAEVYAALSRLGIPTPRLIGEPDPATGLTLCEPPAGENALLWALGGTPHRIRLATERAFESIDRLQGATAALLADPIGTQLPHRTLADEAATIVSEEQWQADTWLNWPASDVAGWRADPWFAGALAQVQASVANINDPLVFTNYLHFFPGWIRIEVGPDPINEPLGWPGDRRMQCNPIVEYVDPDGYIGDPLLGLAMVWIYDCYPFVHTGFVEQYLWRKGLSKRDFGPRLALRALQVIARELPVKRPQEGAEYWDSLHGYVEQGIAWM